MTTAGEKRNPEASTINSRIIQTTPYQEEGNLGGAAFDEEARETTTSRFPQKEYYDDESEGEQLTATGEPLDFL